MLLLFLVLLLLLLRPNKRRVEVALGMTIAVPQDEQVVTWSAGGACACTAAAKEVKRPRLDFLVVAPVDDDDALVAGDSRFGVTIVVDPND